MALIIDDIINNAMADMRQDSDRALQRNLQKKQIESNERIAEQNLAFQQQNLDYQKSLQQQIFAREDTAHQREIQDLKNAGINPLATANGGQGAGAGAIVNTQALNNDMHYDYNAPLPSQMPTINLDGIMQLKMQRDTIDAENQRQEKSLDLDYAKLKQDENEKHLDRLLEINKLEAQTDDWNTKNNLEKERIELQKMIENNNNELRKTQERLNNANASKAEWEDDKWRQRGGTANDSIIGKTTSDIFGRFDDAMKAINEGTKEQRKKALETLKELMSGMKNKLWGN